MIAISSNSDGYGTSFQGNWRVTMGNYLHLSLTNILYSYKFLVKVGEKARQHFLIPYNLQGNQPFAERKSLAQPEPKEEIFREFSFIRIRLPLRNPTPAVYKGI